MKTKKEITIIKRNSGNDYVPINLDKTDLKNTNELDVTKGSKRKRTQIGLIYFRGVLNPECRFSYIPTEKDLNKLKKFFTQIENLIKEDDGYKKDVQNQIKEKIKV